MLRIDVKAKQTKSVQQFCDIEFPICASLCAALKYQRASNGNSICPHELAPNTEGGNPC